jgi:glycosyltransferase involved in cell wall biosynthesis
MPARPHQRILVVIPAWNEAGVIASTIAEVRAARPDVDLLVVDDGSGDATADVAEAAGALVARLPYNLGVGGAMRTGYRFALREGYDVVVQIDADVVVGARFAGAGSYRASGPRRWAMWLLAKVLSRLAGVRLTDVTSGFRAANRRAVTVFADHYPAEYLGDTVESLVIALRGGCGVRQLPVEMRPRTVGQASQSPARATVYLARAIVALGLALVRRWPSATETLGQEKTA